MKNKTVILTIISLFFSSCLVFAEGWEDYQDLDRAWDGQKTITNKEFEQVMDALQAKQKKKEARLKKKRAKKISGGGTSLHKELNPDKEIVEIKNIKQSEDEGILVNIPVKLIIDGKYLEKGFYKVIAKKENDKKVYINLYQAYSQIAKFEATETDEDFEEENVDFARILPYNDSFVKMIFGSIDLNAYAYIPYSE